MPIEHDLIVDRIRYGLADAGVYLPAHTIANIIYCRMAEAHDMQAFNDAAKRILGQPAYGAAVNQGRLPEELYAKMRGV